jgi:glycosyltransferase involved in cell wall biosynthesis
MNTSVCMTTYNGEKYIQEQIESIINQIGENDELIICDDCSSDATIKIVSSFKDKRIKLYVNETNLGFSKNFSKCISLAQGDFIFLSDHDDIWLPNKVEKYMGIFHEDQEVLSIMGNMEIIDENGTLINSRFLDLSSGYGNRWFRISKNVIKSTYYGCSMAFRKELVDKIIPLPFYFDTWIGLVSDIYGRCYYLDETTIQYRRHQNNFSVPKRRNIEKVIIGRIRLIINLVSLITGVRKSLTSNNYLNLLDS